MHFAFRGCNLYKLLIVATSVIIPSIIELNGKTHKISVIRRYAFSDCMSLTIYCKATLQQSEWNSN